MNVHLKCTDFVMYEINSNGLIYAGETDGIHVVLLQNCKCSNDQRLNYQFAAQ